MNTQNQIKLLAEKAQAACAAKDELLQEIHDMSAKAFEKEEYLNAGIVLEKAARGLLATGSNLLTEWESIAFDLYHERPTRGEAMIRFHHAARTQPKE